MDPFDLEFDDVDEYAAFVSATYSELSVGVPPGPTTRARLVRQPLSDLVGVDGMSYEFDVNYELAQEQVTVLASRRGAISSQRPGQEERTVGVGDVGLIGIPGHTSRGSIHHDSLYSVLTIEPVLLARVAWGHAAAGQGRQVTFTDDRPHSPSTTALLRATMRHAREVAAIPGLTPLMADAANQYLATAILDSFPSNAPLGRAREAARDSHSARLRRAMEYVECNAVEQITVADIADAAGISVRALHLAFRRHLETTPMDYVRRVRLDSARRDLLAGNGNTVAQVASRWGFVNQGRFAARYRALYGETPATTLAAARA